MTMAEKISLTAVALELAGTQQSATEEAMKSADARKMSAMVRKKAAEKRKRAAADELRNVILYQLRSGKADAGTIAYLADLFDPESGAKWKVELTYRKEGAEDQRREHSDTLLFLTDIYRRMEKPKNLDDPKILKKHIANFVKLAAYEKNIDPATVRREYRDEVIALAAELDIQDTEWFEAADNRRKSKPDSI